MEEVRASLERHHLPLRPIDYLFEAAPMPEDSDLVPVHPSCAGDYMVRSLLLLACSSCQIEHSAEQTCTCRSLACTRPPPRTRRPGGGGRTATPPARRSMASTLSRQPPASALAAAAHSRLSQPLWQGLPEVWEQDKDTGFGAGAFSLGGQFPAVERNIHLVKGLFSDSIPPLLQLQASGAGLGLTASDRARSDAGRAQREMMGKDPRLETPLAYLHIGACLSCCCAELRLLVLTPALCHRLRLVCGLTGCVHPAEPQDSARHGALRSTA